MNFLLFPLVSSLTLLVASVQAATSTCKAISGMANCSANATWIPSGTPGSVDGVIVVSGGANSLGIPQNRSASTSNDALLTTSFSIFGNSAGDNTLTGKRSEIILKMFTNIYSCAIYAVASKIKRGKIQRDAGGNLKRTVFIPFDFERCRPVAGANVFFTIPTKRWNDCDETGRRFTGQNPIFAKL